MRRECRMAVFALCSRTGRPIHDAPPAPRVRTPPRRQVRDPRGPRPPRRAARARGARDREAQHRQPRSLRLPDAWVDAGRRRGEPPPGRSLLAPKGDLPGPRGRGDAAAEPRRDGRHRRRRVHRQRRVGTDHAGDAGAAQSGRRGARAEPRLPALDSLGRDPRREGGALPLPAGAGLRARSGGDRGADHRPHAGAGADQPE